MQVTNSLILSYKNSGNNIEKIWQLNYFSCIKNIIVIARIYEEFIFQKQITIFKNHVFSLCISINLNQTAVGLFDLVKK